MDYIELIVGLALLIISGRYLVDYAVKMARRLGMSNLIIGMTVVAFGTSAPELLVSISAAFRGSPEISLGNVLGSNIANIGLVLAVTAIIIPIPVQKNTLRYDWPIMMLSFILLSLFMIGDTITRLEGFVLFALLIAYLWWQIKTAKGQAKDNRNNSQEGGKQISLLLAIVVIILASVGLAKGADWLVLGASSIAHKLHISERVISITIVAIGTSLPELTASVIAALKKQTDISVGNIIGSNIFNIFSIIGLTAMIHPLHFNHVPFLIDIGAMLFMGLLLWTTIYPFKSNNITHSEGFMLLASYIAYIILILFVKF
jgi:cation:H+ antiporter